MKDFYVKMLRATPVNTEWTGSWAYFDTGFALHAIPEDAAAGVASPQPREKSPVKLIFAVDDVAAEKSRLEALGVTMLPRSFQQPAESCDGVDPEGNVFQIVAAHRWPQVAGTAR